MIRGKRTWYQLPAMPPSQTLLDVRGVVTEYQMVSISSGYSCLSMQSSYLYFILQSDL